MKAHIFYRKELFYTALGWVVVFTGLDIYILEVVKSRPLEISATICLFLPVLLIPFWRRMYGREVYVELGQDQFTFKIVGRRGGIERTFPLSSLESYQVQYPTDWFCAIRLKSFHHRPVEFTFILKKRDATDADVPAMIDQIDQAIADYNARRTDGHTIGLLLTFYASKAGLWSIITLAVGVVAVALFANLKREGVPLSLLTVLALIFHMIDRRSKELRRYREMKGQ